jgi:hypothetical protein
MAQPRNAAGAGLQIPAPTRRPGSAQFGDVYGGLDFGTTTVAAGGQAATAHAASSSAPGPVSINGISPDFLRQPAGVLVVLIAIIAIWSYLDRG